MFGELKVRYQRHAIFWVCRQCCKLGWFDELGGPGFDPVFDPDLRGMPDEANGMPVLVLGGGGCRCVG